MALDHFFPATNVLWDGSGKLGAIIKDVEDSQIDVGPISLEVNIKGSIIFNKTHPNTICVYLVDWLQ